MAKLKKKRFTVSVFREWTEYGEIEVHAETRREAEDMARAAVHEDAGIEWTGPAHMVPGNLGVELVSPYRRKRKK